MLIETIQAALGTTDILHDIADVTGAIVALPLIGTLVRIAWLLSEMKKDIQRALDTVVEHTKILDDHKPKVFEMWNSHERRKVEL